MQANTSILPNFIVVGANKGGTTSIYHYLRQHPEVYLSPVKEPHYFSKDIDVDLVYVVDYEMQQAEIVILSKGAAFDKNDAPVISLYNEYFGGSMSSIVFQELRESKALAYAVFSAYQTPDKKDKSNYIVSYIGSQADKLPEALSTMTGILNNLPRADALFSTSKNVILKQMQSERITKSDILFDYEQFK